MPVINNPKQEAFCQGIANGLLQSDAYEAAGYQRSPSAASQLASQAFIQARIQELIAEKQGRVIAEQDDIENVPSEINRDWLLRTLMKNVKIAQTAQQIAPANKAIEMIAELIGMSIKKPTTATQGIAEAEDKDDGIDMSKVSDGIGKLNDFFNRREGVMEVKE